MSRSSNYYNVIGIKNNAPPAVVREAYRNWRGVYKPLLNEENAREIDTDQRWARQQAVRRIDAAYNALLVKPRRKRLSRRSH